MRVLHFCPQFSPLSETFVYGYITEMERQGVDVQVMTLERMNARDRPFSRVHVASCPGLWNPRLWWYRAITRASRRNQDIYAWPIIRRRLMSIVANVQPDVIHAHFGTAGYLVSPVSTAAQIPLVVTFYGHDISSVALEPAWQPRYRDLWRWAAGVTVLSSDMREKASSLGCPREKIHVVHLAPSIPPAPVARRVFPLQSFISVGRLVEKKGHADSIRSFAIIARRHPGIRLDIVGEGPLQSALQALAKAEGVADRIRIHGGLPNKTVVEMMRAAGAFLLCSKRASDGDEEGTPTVLVEAQLLRLPCLTTHHAGIPEVIAPENHWLLAPEGDIPAIADRIEMLLQQSPQALEQIVAAGWRHVSEHFDLPSESRKLVRLYESLRMPATSG